MDTLWAKHGAWRHSANGTAGITSESIRPHYSSSSATIFSLRLFLFLATPHPFFPSFPLPPVHAFQPLFGMEITAPTRFGEIYITCTPRIGSPLQLAALTLIDLAPVMTQAPRETFGRRRGKEEVRKDEGVYP